MKKPISYMLLALSVGLTSGCAGPTKNWSKSMPWADKTSQISESKYQAPAKLVALWSPAMYNTPGKPATRGFGGRIYFYNAKNEPVPVEGQLVVYCYDDTDKTSDHKQADRRVAFTPEQFSSHFSPTELGASYSVWVPWDAVGNPQAEISLVPIFTAASGQVVVGQQSLGLLPGPETPLQEKTVEHKVLTATATRDGDITRVGFDEDISAQGLRESRIQTTSVTLPQNLAERVAASRIQEPAQISPQVLQTYPSALPANPPTAESETPEVNPTTEETRESSTANSTLPHRLRPEQLSHSERSQPRAPTMQPPRPIAGPARLQPPQLKRPSSLPSPHE